MSTGNQYANIAQKKLLGYRDLNDRFLQYVRGLVHEAHSRVWDASAIHDGALTMEADGANAIKITGTSIAADGEGRLLRISDAAVNDGINFENTNLVDYYVALKYVDVPDELDINPRTGNPEFRSWTEEVGEKAVPDAVTDNGNGTITFQVDGVTEAGVTNAGRQVLVYKLVADKNATTFAVAVETCTVSWTGSQNEITTTGTLGQSTVSTVAADYNVIMLGPTIKRYVDLRTVSGYVFVGIVTGNGGTPADFDHTDQNLATVSLSQLANIASKAPNGRAKIDVIPAIGEEGIGQIQSRDENQNIMFRIDELGRVESDYPPYVNRRPLSKGNDNKTKLVVPSTRNWGALVPAIISGVRKMLMAAADLEQTLEIYDCETMSLDGNTGALGGLPDISPETWHAIHIMCDGRYAYVYFVGTSVGGPQQLQCYDIETWTVRSGWPATGVVVTPGVGFTYVGRPMVDIDENTFAYCTYSTIGGPTSDCVRIASKLDGSTIAYGAGDAPAGSDQIKSICYDGDYIFGLTHRDNLCSIDPTAPSSGCGGTNWPYHVGIGTSTNGIRGIACGDGLVVCVGDDSEKMLFHVATASNADLIRGYSSDFTKFKELFLVEYDGVNFWALGTRDYGIKKHILFGGASSGGKVQLSNTKGESWVEIGQALSGTVYGLWTHPNGTVVAVTGPSGRIFRSADFGFTWTEVAVFSTGDIECVAGWEYNGYAVAGDEDGDIYQSTDFGANWSQVETALDGDGVHCIATFPGSGGIAIAGTGNNGRIYRTTDFGANWSLADDTAIAHIRAIATFDNGYALAAGSGGVIFQSTDYGANWAQVYDHPSESNIWGIATLDNGFALASTGTNGIMLRSTDFGTNWEEVQEMGTTYPYDIIMFEDGLALVSGLSKMYKSTNFGITWKEVDTNMSPTSFAAFTAANEITEAQLFKLNVRGPMTQNALPAIAMNGEDYVKPFSYDLGDSHLSVSTSSLLAFDGRDFWVVPDTYSADKIYRLTKALAR